MAFTCMSGSEETSSLTLASVFTVHYPPAASDSYQVTSTWSWTSFATTCLHKKLLNGELWGGLSFEPLIGTKTYLLPH